MKILLTTLNSKYIHLNLAIRLLYQQNKSYKSLQYKEFTIKDNLEDIAKQCAEFDLVAFSCYVWNIKQTTQLAKIIKEIKNNCLILLGGPEVSYIYDQIMILPQIDFIIRGEGEIAFKKFIENIGKWSNVPNLVWKNNGKIIENQQTTNFDLLELKDINPYIDDEISQLKHKVCYIEASRGCPYKCGFCIAGLDNKVRFYDLETVKNNLLFLMQNVRTIKFLDRTFNANVNFAISIIDFVVKNHKQGNIFQFEIKADIYQEKLVEYIKNNVPKGLLRFEIGIQTTNEKANSAVLRKQNYENIKRFINEISDIVEIHADLIVGLPFDYWEDIKQCFEEVFGLFVPELQLGFLKFLKGTPIEQNQHIHGYIYENQPPFQIISSKYLSKHQIERIVRLENALDIYWNKKRAINTLIYVAKNYSIFDFLLGLGENIDHFVYKTYTLTDVYQAIFNFVEQKYSNDNILKELVAIDYYLQHKVRPKILFIEEIDKKEKNEILENIKLNVNKFRYLIFSISLDLEYFLRKKQIKHQKAFLILQYDGKNKPKTTQI